MENKLKLFTNDLFELATKLENGEWVFDAEKVAKDLGFTEIKNDKEYVRWNRVNDYLKSFATFGEIKKGDFIPEAALYKLAFKANNDVAEKFQDWLAIEVIPQLRKTGSFTLKETTSFEEKLENLKLEQQGLKFALDLISPSQSSTVKMLRDFNESQGLSIAYLPIYVDEEVGMSLSSLLKEFNINLSAVKFNRLLLEYGILVDQQRKSTSNVSGVKTYKVLTEKGLEYGKNEINTKGSGKDSQPLYYKNRFEELINLVGAEVVINDR